MNLWRACQRGVRQRVSYKVSLFMVAVPLAALQTLPLSLIAPSSIQRLLVRFIPAQTRESPPNDCIGQPVGTGGEKILEHATRLYETLSAFCLISIGLFAVGIVLTGIALYQGNRREPLLLTATLWVTTASVASCAALLAYVLRQALLL